MKRFLTLSAMLLLLSVACIAKPKSVTLRLIGTTDVHGSFFPTDFITRKPRAGSMARFSTFVKQLRADNSQQVVLLDAGDILQGQPSSYFYNYENTKQENIAASVINYLQYDAQVVGNHDVEPGHAVYDKWIGEVKCPMLGANIIDTTTGKPYVNPYIILNRGGVRIAVFGMITPAIPNWLQPAIWSGLRFDDMVACAKQWIPFIQKHEQPDVIVGVFHSGKSGGITTAEYEEDASLKVAEQVPGFDVIFFGHDHTQFNGKVTNIEGKEVICINGANNARTVSDVCIELTKRHGHWTITNKEGQLVNLSQFDVDQDYMDHFKAQLEEINNYVNRPIGYFAHSITTRDCYFGNSAFTDLILNLQLEITGADIAFNAPLQFNATINEGPVYVSDMFNLYKFENQLYVMRLSGEEIRKHLEMSYDLWVNTMTSPDDHLLLLSENTFGDQQRLGFKNFSFNFDSAAGIDYVVDVTKPNGQKVKILQMSNGEPFDESRIYNVAINSYRANGGGELLTRGAGIPKEELESRIVWRSERDQRFYLMQEIEKKQRLDPKPNSNWRFVPEEWAREAGRRDSLILFSRK